MGLWRQRRPNGTIYVLDSQRYWDEEQQKYRIRQKCIGKIDPDTGEIVPNKSKPGPKPGSHRTKRDLTPKQEIKKLTTLYVRAEERVAVLKNHIKKMNEENSRLFNQISELTIQVQELTKKLNMIRSLASLTPVSGNAK